MVKVLFYDPGFYVLCEFMTFLHAAAQIPITIMLKCNGFYVSVPLCFPRISTLFCSPGYKNLPKFMIYSSIITVSYPRQQASFRLSSCKYFGLKICIKWLMHSCK
jgi:hypothetical protein